MFLSSDSDFQRELNSVITTSGTPNVRIGQNRQTTVFDHDTVMSLLEGTFAMSTLPNFEFYMQSTCIYGNTNDLSFLIVGPTIIAIWEIIYLV